MRSNRKLVSLICALSMILSLFSGLIVHAEGGVGATLKLVSSTDTQAVFDVGYKGVDTLTQLSLNIPVDGELLADNGDKKDVAIEFASGFTACKGSYNAKTGNIVLTGADADGFTNADKKIATVTMNFASAITSDVNLAFSKAVFTDDQKNEYSAVADSDTIVVPAPTPVPPTKEPVPDDATVSKGIVLTLDSDASAADTVVFNVTYVGLPDTLTQLSINIPVDTALIADNGDKKDVTVAYADGFTACKGSYNAKTGNIVLTGADADGFTNADKKIATVTIKLAAALEDTLKLELSKAVVTDDSKVEYGLDKDGDQKLDASYIYVTPEKLVPTETTAPAETTVPTETTAPAETTVPSETTAPSATPVPKDDRPTPVPVETEAPAEETEAPAVPTAEPDAVVSKGVVLTLDSDASAADTVVFNVTYVGLPDTLTQLSINIPVDTALIADKGDKKDVTVAYADGFTACKGSYNAKTGNIVLTGADADGFTNADKKIATVTIKLAAALEDTLKLELTKAVVTDDSKVEYGLDKEGDQKLDPSYIYVTPDKLDPKPTPAPTEAPVPTVVPTEAPIVDEIKLEDVLTSDLAKGAEDEDKTPFVTYTVTKANGDPAKYGEDYVVKDSNGNIVPKEVFEQDIYGYNTELPVSEAIKKYKIVAYTPVKLSAKLQTVEDPYALESKEVTLEEKTTPDATATPKPGKQGEAEFTRWTPTTLSVSKTTTKEPKVIFSNVPENATNVYVEFAPDNKSYLKVNKEKVNTTVSNIGQVSASVRVTGNTTTSRTTSLNATLWYTVDGEQYWVEADPLTVKVTSSSSSGSGGSSSISTSGGIIAGNNTSATGGLANFSVVGDVKFTDLGEAEWARDAVTYLAERGIVNGRSATSFEPNGYITRAEFAKLVVTVFGITPAEGIEAISFSDVQSGSWYTPYVMTAAHYGIVTGYPDGLFRPDALVSRQEMALMMYRACTTFGIRLETINAPVQFTDGVADWASAAVTALQVAGVVNGTSATTFGPEDASTRAQAAQMIYNLYAVVA